MTNVVDGVLFGGAIGCKTPHRFYLPPYFILPSNHPLNGHDSVFDFNDVDLYLHSPIRLHGVVLT
jgi:hypothetical protein